MLRHDEVFTNPAKALLREKKKTIACWLQLGSPAVAEAIAQTGIDWVVIDMEHGPGDLQTLIHQMQAIKGYGVAPLVRAPGNDPIAIKKVLDAGAYGIHIPYLHTKEDVERAVRACKYPPSGIRGVSSTGRASGYALNAMNYLRQANDEILVLAAVETRSAAEHIEEFLSVEGLDGVFIGPMDLSTDMGYFGTPSAPEVQEMISKVEKAVVSSGKVLAGTCGDFETAKKMFDRGYTLVYAMADTALLTGSAMKLVKAFAEEYPER